MGPCPGREGQKREKVGMWMVRVRMGLKQAKGKKITRCSSRM